MSSGLRLRTLAEVVDHLGADGKTGVIDDTGIRARRPGTGRKGRDTFVSGKNKQNAVKTLVVADSDDQVLFRNPAKPGSCADITRARRLGLIEFLADRPALEVLADADYQGLGVQTGGRVVTPPHRTFKNPRLVRGDIRAAAQGALPTADPGRARYRSLEELAGLAHRLGRRGHMSHTVQAVPGPLSHQQTVDLTSARPV